MILLSLEGGATQRTMESGVAQEIDWKKVDEAAGRTAAVTGDVAGDFLDLAFRFFDSAFDLVFVHAHDLLLITYAGNGRHAVVEDRKADA